jgi:polysaccharide biosynthesis protein PslH
MRVVFLTSRMPCPPEGGDRFRVFHLLRTISEAGHEVHLVTFDSGPTPRFAIASLHRMLASIQVVRLPKLLSAWRSAQALPSRIPLQTAYYQSRRMRERVGEVLHRVRPHIVYTHLFRMAPYALERMGPRRTRWVLDLTDVISAGIERSLPYRRGADLWIYREEMKRISTYEASIAPRFDECWVISDAERRVLAALAPEANVRVIPNGFPTEPLGAGSERERAKLVFFGFHEVFHNRDAVRFLVEEIFPRVRASVPDATLDITGKGAESLGRWVRRPGVRVVGYVPRLEEVFARAAVFVAPHRFAAGVQNKVLHALASGTPVVSTPAVQTGLEPIPDGIMRVGRGPDEIAGHVIELILDPVRAQALGARGREWARSRFSWRTALDAIERPEWNVGRPGVAEPLVAAGI